ncbi:MAG: transcription antitermination factor NusB [Dethiobacteria bacterium]|jgi:N utilization substance protein B|nr:transcription antitermination factor NusB [Bacillota bacterium]
MSRRLARENAFKTLFQIDVGKIDPKKALERALQESGLNKKNSAFIRELVEGVLNKQEDIDQVIKKYLVNWNLKRLANVDRSILRLAVFEILYRPDIPTVTAIDEAVELARIYQGKKSASFINGLLDRVMRDFAVKETEDEIFGD